MAIKTAIAAALIVGAASAAQAPALEALNAYSFEAFTKDFEKTYATAEERASREATFNANLKMINAHNANPHKSWTMNVNHMADWSEDERVGLLTGMPSAKMGLTPMHLPSQQKQQRLHSASSLPHSIDWRSAVPQVVSAVKNQGRCGSCWAFAAAATLESTFAVRTGKLFDMSTQQLTSCTPNPNHCGGTGGCQGSTANLAFQHIIDNGGITEEFQYPYTSYYGNTGVCGAPSDARSVANFTHIVNVEGNSRDATMEALVTAGPLAVNVDASKWSFYQSGVFDGCAYDKNININHVVQLVGYGTDHGLKKDYWLIRNSWSANFGENGYIRLLREPTTVCGTDSTPENGTGCKGGPSSVKACGQCGVLYEVSYAEPAVAPKDAKPVRLH